MEEVFSHDRLIGVWNSFFLNQSRFCARTEASKTSAFCELALQPYQISPCF
jgi:hypothetical protein